MIPMKKAPLIAPVSFAFLFFCVGSFAQAAPTRATAAKKSALSCKPFAAKGQTSKRFDECTSGNWSVVREQGRLRHGTYLSKDKKKSAPRIDVFPQGDAEYGVKLEDPKATPSIRILSAPRLLVDACVAAGKPVQFKGVQALECK